MHALPTVPPFAFPVWIPENLVLHAGLTLFVRRCWNGVRHGLNQRRMVVDRRAVVIRAIIIRRIVGDRLWWLEWHTHCLLGDFPLALARLRHVAARRCTAPWTDRCMASG